MTEEEKAAQLNTAMGPEPAQNDLDVLFPKPETWSLGDREYEISPFKFSQIEMLERIQAINPGAATSKDLDNILELVSSVLKESDKVFIKDNLDPIELQDLISTVMKLNTTGIPVNKKKAMSRRGLSVKG